MWKATVILLALAGCPGGRHPPEAPPPYHEAMPGPQTVPPYTTEGEPPPTMPPPRWDDLYEPPPELDIHAGGTCVADTDCVVVRAIAGLDHVPDPATETCGTLCYVGLRRDLQRNWEDARERFEDRIPCDRPARECPPIYDYVAVCTRATCTLADYAPLPMTPPTHLPGAPEAPSR